MRRRKLVGVVVLMGLLAAAGRAASGSPSSVNVRVVSGAGSTQQDPHPYSPFVLRTPPDFLEPTADKMLTRSIPFPATTSRTKASLVVADSTAMPWDLDTRSASVNSGTQRTSRAEIADSAVEFEDLSGGGFRSLLPQSSSTAKINVIWKMEVEDLVGTSKSSSQSGTVTNSFHLDVDAGQKDSTLAAGQVQQGAFRMQNGIAPSALKLDAAGAITTTAGGFFSGKKISRGMQKFIDVVLSVTVKRSDINKRRDGTSLGDSNAILLYFNGFAQTDVKATGSYALTSDPKRVTPALVTHGFFNLNLPDDFDSYSFGGKSLDVAIVSATQLPTIPLPPAVWPGLIALAGLGTICGVSRLLSRQLRIAQ